MKWQDAREIIARTLLVGTDLNTVKSRYRKVVAADADVNSVRYGYHSERGFVISVARHGRVAIPWTLLESCFNALGTPDGYNGKVFRKRFPLQAADHPCHIHVVGRIFTIAEIAAFDGTSYRLKWVNAVENSDETPRITRTAEEAFGDVRGRLRYTESIAADMTAEWSDA